MSLTAGKGYMKTSLNAHEHTLLPTLNVANNAVVLAAVLSVINKSLGSYGID